MKPIKFRAWHKLSHKMVDVAMLDFQLDAYRAVDGTFSGSGHLADIELLQYTGLSDKHGNEGYQGHIVKLFDRSLFVIDWNEYYARFELQLVSGKEHCKVHDMGMLQMGEIVGMMYEMPDLLKANHAT